MPDRDKWFLLLAESIKKFVVDVMQSFEHAGVNMSWSTTKDELTYTEFQTTSSGLCDIEVRFKWWGQGYSNRLDFEYYEDEESTPSFTKTVQIENVGGIPIDSTLLK
ncbi:MAG: hypothetical protein KAR19_18645 [Bacteroidales bacterium]|nr:hypothetical protein [Bacteroidales bacterium]